MSHRILLIDAAETSREVMARRLNAQGYSVETTSDPMQGAEAALSAPPAAVIADFWMPAISGIQLCRLLRTEPATAEVPVILRGDDDDPRSRFWAERAGAAGYVRKGRMGELVRVLSRAIVPRQESDGFFLQLGGGSVDIRERIARYLDAALFESVIAAEVRSLSSAGSFERLFDLFAQLLVQVIHYRWLALLTKNPEQLAIHHHPQIAEAAEREARTAFGIGAALSPLRLVDEDPSFELDGAAPVVCSVPFGGVELGRLALGPRVVDERDTPQLVALVGRELAGPLRITALMDEQRRLSQIDPLTGLRNRRAFVEQARTELARSERYGLALTLVLLDVDHFKSINDNRGHGAGDHVLTSLGALLRQQLRVPDLAARWGGEEFVVALPNTDLPGAEIVAERLRAAIGALRILHDGVTIPVTASLGVAAFQAGDSLEAFIERADRAMYAAKAGGRNRVVLAAASEAPVCSRKVASAS